MSLAAHPARPVPAAARGAGRLSAGALVGLCLTATFAISVTQILLGVALAALLVHLATARDPRAWAVGLEGPLLALLLWAVAMVPLSGDRAQSALFLRRFYLFAALFIAAGAVRGAAGARVRRWALIALLAGGAGTALYGLVGYARTGGAFVDAWDGYLKNRVVLTQNYMTAGGLMMVTCLVALAFLLVARPRRGRLLVAAAALPMAAALLLTLTRSAWLGFGAGAVVMMAMTRHRLALGAMALGLAALLLLPGLVRDRFLSAFDPANYQNTPRLVMWGVGLEVVADHPWTGVGDRNLNELYWAYRERAAGAPVSREAYPGGPVLAVGHLHNNVLQVAAIWGLPGLALVVVLMVALWRRLRAVWRGLRTAAVAQDDPAPPEGWVLAAMGVWWGFVVAGMFEWYFGDAEVALLAWLVSGLALGADRLAAARAAGGASPPQSA
ncbi:MAG: O-antigen ligase family protein [Candidatus Krumholzibacteriia bacterium]